MARSRNAQLVAAELARFGMSSNKVNALVGGFMQESGPGLNPTISHDGGTGFGIAGFRDPKPGQGRWSNLRNFARANNWDVNDPVTQARFTAHELGYKDPVTGQAMAGPGFNAEARASAMMRNASTIEGAARGAIAYERPYGFSWDRPERGHGFSNRLSNARGLAGILAEDVVPSTPGTYSGSTGSEGVMRDGPTVERAAAMANASPSPEPAAPTTEPDITLKDLTSVEGWKRALGNEAFNDKLTGILGTATGASQQAPEPLSIDPAMGLSSDDFASRFSAASQLMQNARRPRGILAGVM